MHHLLPKEQTDGMQDVGAVEAPPTEPLENNEVPRDDGSLELFDCEDIPEKQVRAGASVCDAVPGSLKLKC